MLSLNVKLAIKNLPLCQNFQRVVVTKFAMHVPKITTNVLKCDKTFISSALKNEDAQLKDMNIVLINSDCKPTLGSTKKVIRQLLTTQGFFNF